MDMHHDDGQCGGHAVVPQVDSLSLHSNVQPLLFIIHLDHFQSFLGYDNNPVLSFSLFQ